MPHVAAMLVVMPLALKPSFRMAKPNQCDFCSFLLSRCLQAAMHHDGHLCWLPPPHPHPNRHLPWERQGGGSPGALARGCGCGRSQRPGAQLDLLGAVGRQRRSAAVQRRQGFLRLCRQHPQPPQHRPQRRRGKWRQLQSACTRLLHFKCAQPPHHCCDHRCWNGSTAACCVCAPSPLAPAACTPALEGAGGDGAPGAQAAGCALPPWHEHD
jgi:hypothetical protein